MLVLIILSANTSNKIIEFFIKLHVSYLVGFIVELPHSKCAQQNPIALLKTSIETIPQGEGRFDKGGKGSYINSFAES